jgi:transposase-like protein
MSDLEDALLMWAGIANKVSGSIRKRKPPNLDEIQKVAIAAENILRAYVAPANWPNGYRDTPAEPFPVLIAARLADEIARVRRGTPSPYVRDLIQVGAPKTLPAEARVIGMAAAYRKAVADGLINDRKPTKTLAELYGVTPKTIKKWVREYREVSIRDFFPDAADDVERAERLKAGIPEAGEQYRRWGRGASGRAEFHSDRAMNNRGDLSE